MSIVICDIDGTIANRQARLLHSMKEIYDTDIEMGSPEWYDIFLDGDLLCMDTPIERARWWLWRYHEEGWKIFYLSGRRQRTYSETLAWLRSHNFPEGERVLLRPKGRSEEFKTEVLKRLFVEPGDWKDENYKIGFGDIQADIEAYESADIEGVLVDEDGNGWRWPDGHPGAN